MAQRDQDKPKNVRSTEGTAQHTCDATRFSVGFIF